MLKLQNKFKLNLQLFAEPTEPPVPPTPPVPPVPPTPPTEGTPPAPQFVSIEEFNNGMKKITDLLAAMKAAPTPPTPPNPPEPPIDNKPAIPKDAPDYVKTVLEQNEKLLKDIEANKNNALEAQKNELKNKYGLDDSDLLEIKDEITLKATKKALEKYDVKKAADFEKNLPAYLEKKGQTLTDLSKINEQQKQADEKMTKVFDSFFHIGKK